MGCWYVSQIAFEKFYKHMLYSTWRMMNVRCYDESHISYHRYGGRGISVCFQWRWDNPLGFVNFLSDMSPRPVGRTLDRIDNNSHYAKDNCKWSTRKEQQNNMSHDSTSNTTGEVCIQKLGKTYKVLISLDNKVHIVGIFSLSEFDESVLRRDLVKQWKREYSDIEVIEKILQLDKRTPLNKRIRVNKTSRFYGVSWDKSRSKWRAMVSYRENQDSKIINKMLGRYDCETEAYESVKQFLELVERNGWYKKGLKRNE